MVDGEEEGISRLGCVCYSVVKQCLLIAAQLHFGILEARRVD